jgi:hypothetical protein
MKKFFSNAMLIASVGMVGLFASCSKDDDVVNNAPTRTKEYRLYNSSTGSPLDAGAITFTQLPDSTASATINLASGYRINGVSMPASITTTVSGNELTYASLANVDGTTGVSNTSVVRGSSNIAVKYDTLITRIGFRIKVMNGAVLQAQGTIQ